MKPDVREALRYLGVRGEPDAELLRTMSALAERLAARVTPKYVYRVFPVSPTGDGVVLEGAGLTLPGELAVKTLAECSQAAVFLCTLGAGFETLFRAEQARGLDRAVMLDALGSAYVETGCDAAEAEIAARFPGQYLTDRFSPGYGDLPLSLQREVCALLDARRRLGVQVTDSLLMNPVKSVTAVVGIAAAPQPARIRGCGVCPLRERCAYRKGGMTCGT